MCDINYFVQKLGMKRNMYGEYAVMKRIHSLFQVCLFVYLVVLINLYYF